MEIIKEKVSGNTLEKCFRKTDFIQQEKISEK